ncbi:hypothetical protein GFY24_18360 [Nocardia sp. SYP-A9097]|uniref:hypothetical protein n=1 Tax=Nocardia sp. SYP-A9097 TaxID=2663237 RepID=UPI00129ABBD7|nr:hypothetical protein [Nocardia sp. SYP-A9097]MRH89388.1 hypothetical protein [Nocardia sp. SYP-A9097]
MNIRRTTLTAAIAATGAIISATTAGATPEPAAPQVGYHATLSEGTVITTLDNGTFDASADPASIAIRNTAGQVLDSLPLSFTIDGQRVPVDQQISADGHELRLTPQVQAVDRTALQPVASPLEDQLAMNDLINAISIGTSVGSLIGTAIGGALGVGVGLAITGAACIAISIGCVVAVLPIVALVGGVGGLVGMVVGGGPTTAYALYQYVTTLNSAAGTSKYAPNLQGRPGIPAADAASAAAPN